MCSTPHTLCASVVLLCPQPVRDVSVMNISFHWGTILMQTPLVRKPMYLQLVMACVPLTKMTMCLCLWYLGSQAHWTTFHNHSILSRNWDYLLGFNWWETFKSPLLNLPYVPRSLSWKPLVWFLPSEQVLSVKCPANTPGPPWTGSLVVWGPDTWGKWSCTGACWSQMWNLCGNLANKPGYVCLRVPHNQPI